MTQRETDLQKDPLPAGWRWVKLGDIAEFLDSQRKPINQEERARRIAGKNQASLYPYFGANGQVGWIDDFLFDGPAILLAEDGGYFGSREKPIAYTVSGRYWVNNHAHILRPKDGVDFSFLYRSLSIRPDIGDLVSGSTRAKLNQQVASTISIPLPSLSEQKRIAAILNEQMAALEKAKKAAQEDLETIEAIPPPYFAKPFPENSNDGNGLPILSKLQDLFHLRHSPTLQLRRCFAICTRAYLDIVPAHPR